LETGKGRQASTRKKKKKTSTQDGKVPIFRAAKYDQGTNPPRPRDRPKLQQ